VLTLAMPEWDLPVLPSKAPVGMAPPAAPVSVALPETPARHEHRHVTVTTSVAPEPAPMTAAPTPRRASGHWPSLPSLPTLLLAIWIAGSCLVLARVAIGHLMLLHLSRQGRPLRGAAWASLAERAAEEAGLDRPFELLECDRIGVPATFGIVRPLVLLPPSAREWPEERRRAVLVHELAHAARYDCLTQLLAQIACALYWFHPGAWWAEQRMRIERESACDDRVLEGRMAASDYADHLIEVLREARRAGLPGFGAVAFARRSSLEGRLLALLDPLRDRRSPSRGIAWSAGLTTGILLLALAGVQLGAAPPPDMKVSVNTVAPPSVPASAPPSEVMLAPDTGTDLVNRWAWAVQGSAGQAHGGMWIGYGLSDTRAGGGHGLLSDSEGIDLALLNGHATGPTLLDVLSRRGDFLGGRPAPDAVAILFHVTRRGTVDRVRTQSFSMPPPPGGQPLYWLGKAGDEQSLAWLRQLNDRVPDGAAKKGILDAASYHHDGNAWLGQVAQSDECESVRAAAAEGLGRHPTPESIRVLDQLARADRSAEVRKCAIEALGEVDDPASASVLFETARSHVDANPPEESSPSSESSSDDPGTPTPPMVQSRTVTEVHSVTVQAEAMAKTGECMKKACESIQKCKEKQISAAAMTEAAAEIAQAESDAAGVSEDKDKDEDSDDVQVQVEAVETLGSLPEAQALPRLARIARTHAVSRVRLEAVETIGGFKNDQALAVLDDLVWSAPDPRVQMEAVESYTEWSPAQQLQRLTKIARTHPRPEVRAKAVEQLGQLEPQLVLPTLEGVVNTDSELSVQIEAVDAIGSLSDQAGTPALEKIAKSKLPARVRREAIEAIGHDDPSAALPVIEEILQDKQPTP
jgi:beta-lactamase regulating signal transducer with metallopeptidase domain/HEAT repeat protein